MFLPSTKALERYLEPTVAEKTDEVPDQIKAGIKQFQTVVATFIAEQRTDWLYASSLSSLLDQIAVM